MLTSKVSSILTQIKNFLSCFLVKKLQTYFLDLLTKMGVIFKILFKYIFISSKYMFGQIWKTTFLGPGTPTTNWAESLHTDRIHTWKYNIGLFPFLNLGLWPSGLANYNRLVCFTSLPTPPWAVTRDFAALVIIWKWHPYTISCGLFLYISGFR